MPSCNPLELVDSGLETIKIFSKIVWARVYILDSIIQSNVAWSVTNDAGCPRYFLANPPEIIAINA